MVSTTLFQLCSRERMRLQLFGPLYGEWSDAEKNRACSNVSYILINSKNYATAVSHNVAADSCRPTKDNFEDFEIVDRSNVVHLSIVQDFGEKDQKRVVRQYQTAWRESTPW